MSRTSISNQEWSKEGFSQFKVAKKIAVPNTEIINRAKITDLASSLSASMGIERITSQAAFVLSKESGPSGESVYELSNKDERVRLVGTWVNASATEGTYIRTDTNGDFIEVTFYGTVRNALMQVDNTVRV